MSLVARRSLDLVSRRAASPSRSRGSCASATSTRQLDPQRGSSLRSPGPASAPEAQCDGDVLAFRGGRARRARRHERQILGSRRAHAAAEVTAAAPSITRSTRGSRVAPPPNSGRSGRRVIVDLERLGALGERPGARSRCSTRPSSPARAGARAGALGEDGAGLKTSRRVRPLPAPAAPRCAPSRATRAIAAARHDRDRAMIPSARSWMRDSHGRSSPALERVAVAQQRRAARQSLEQACSAGARAAALPAPLPQPPAGCPAPVSLLSSANPQQAPNSIRIRSGRQGAARRVCAGRTADRARPSRTVVMPAT